MEQFNQHPNWNENTSWWSILKCDWYRGRKNDWYKHPHWKWKKREGKIEDDFDCYWKWVDWIWDLRFEKYEKWGIIKQGIDGNGRDKWDWMWWNGCDNKGYLWYIWLGEIIWWIERGKREIPNCYWK